MEKDGWRAFAENNNLTYKSRIFLIREPYVTGSYGPYKFRLETFSRSKQVSTTSRGGMTYSSSQIHTRMILQASKSMAMVSSRKALDKAGIVRNPSVNVLGFSQLNGFLLGEADLSTDGQKILAFHPKAEA